MIPALPLSRVRFVGAVSAFVVLVPASAPLLAQEATPPLEDLVPTSAYSLLHVQHDPSMEFVQDASRKVMNAVKDARFHELAVEAISIAGANGEDVQQIGSLVELVTTRVTDVDWEALVENEMVYAEAPISPLPGSPPGLGSLLFACRPDPSRVNELERSLSGLLGAADSLTNELALDVEERPGTNDVSTRVYSLQTSGSEMHPVVQMAVRDDVIMVGFGDQLFGDALAILEGTSRQSLARTRRYKTAVGELADGTPSLMYFDTHRLLDWLEEEIPSFMEHSGAPSAIIAPVQDIIALADITDVSVTAIHAEGHDLISECWTSFRPVAAEQHNPLLLALTSGQPTGELLDFVPADAISFKLAQDIDLRPLYRWGLERFEYYVPKASDILMQLEIGQALVDLSIEDDLLSWVGSETITITMPSQRFGGDTDTIMIARLRDPAGARKVIDRLQAVFDAAVPPLLERLEEELAMQGNSSPIGKLTLGDASGSFPSMKQLEIAISVPDLPIPLPIPAIPTITFGVIGNLLLVTTSVQAIETVFSVAAGEADGLWEHPAFQTGDRLPSQVVASASLEPVGRQIREVASAITAASSVMGMMVNLPGGAPNTAKDKILGLMTLCMQKVAGIMRSIDFLDDAVCYSEMRDEGMTLYSRTSTRYVASDN